MRCIVIDYGEYKQRAIREAQASRSDYLRAADASEREELRDAEWEGVAEIHPLPTLIASLVGLAMWGGIFYLLV